MKYSEIKNVLPNANYGYIDFTPEQVEALTVEHYLTEINGVAVLGTVEPVEALAELAV